MKQEDSILKKFGKDSGMRVPDGYFSDLESRVMDALPPYQSRPASPEMTVWQRFKPYVYLAAMFAGIWIMMSVFHKVSQPLTLTPDNAPESLVQLLDHEGVTLEYMLMMPYEDYDIEEEVILSYDSFEDFERDFDASED